MLKKLTELRPCDNCGGPVRSMFHVIRTSMATVNVQAVNEFFGMHQFFGGKASVALVENFAPAAADAITVAMDKPEFQELMTELVICHGCFCDKPLDLPMLIERINERDKSREKAEAR